MKLTYTLLGAASAVLLASCSAPASDDTTPETPEQTETTPADAGTAPDTAELTENLQGVADATYSLEPNHAFLTATVMHNGLSEYTIDFTTFDGTLQFDPADPAPPA